MSKSNETEKPATSEEDFHYNLDPGQEYRLNVFLVELAKSISSEELKDLKFFLQGDGGLGQATLEKITNPLELFKHLKQKRSLSIDNICMLQALIWNLGRKDLYRKIVEYSRQFQNILYFYAPKETPENGFKYVTFHVEGNSRRSDVETLQMQVANLLCVPRQYVIVAGVEKSNSIIITLMIHEECEMVLSNLSDREKAVLTKVCVNHFTIDGNVFSLTDKVYKEEVDEELLAVRKAIENEAKLRKELDICHADLVAYKRTVEELSDSCVQNEAESFQLFCYMQMASMKYNTFLLEQMNKYAIPSTLRRQTTMRQLVHLTKKAKQLGYDCTLIEAILEMNSVIVRDNVTKAYKMFIEKQRWELEIEKYKQMYHQYINQRLSYQLGQTLKETEGNWNINEFWQYVAIQRALQNAVPVIRKIVEVEADLQIDRETSDQILYELAQRLSKEEKDTLFKSVKMNKEDQELYRENPNKVLQIILLKTRKPGAVNADKFVRDCLETIKRQDLLTEYNKILERIIKEKTTMTQPSTKSKAGTSQFKKVRKQPFKRSSRKASDDSGYESSPGINSRLQKLEKMMEKVIENTTPSNQSHLPFDDLENKKLQAKRYFSQKYQQALDREILDTVTKRNQ